MNLPDILKQFKNIEPDPASKEISKRVILAQKPHEPWNTRRTIMAFFETGVAVALSVFFILVVTGLFPTSSYVSPAQFSVINPTSLHAEAQAVDIQIQLADVNYTEATTSMESTTPAIAEGIIASTPPLAILQTKTASSSSSPMTTTATASSSQPTNATTSSSSSTPASIDEALQELTQ